MTSLMSLAGDLVGGFLGTVKQPPLKEVEGTDTSIQVCVRIRPILRNEKEDTDSYAWNWEDKTLYPQIASQLPYTFDHLFFPESTNEEIFDDVVKKVVLQSMNGYNGSIFTYGQTSSGKTFTMNGSHSQPGIIPQSIYFCFKSIQDSFPEREFLFRVSYIEVYNEQVKDLLNAEPAHIKIQHDPKLGTILSGVKEQVVLSPQQVIALIRAGEAQRHVGATDMNESSSRAHTVFKLIIESRQRGDSTDAPVRASFLNLIDLAGSENAKMTNSTGDRAREAKHINQSLLTLSLIIFKLSEEKAGSTKKMYYPYRDSKLTRLLQSSLSGNAKIAVICTVSPTLRCVDETHNTLRFATRAKKIKTHASVNEVMDDKTLLKAYKMEINLLKARLAAMEGTHSEGQGQLASPLLQIMNGMKDTVRTGSTEENDCATDDNEIESEGLILQMISEMERLILKADVVASEAPSARGKTLTGKKSISAPAAGCSFGSKADASRATSLTASKGKSLKTSPKSPLLDKNLRAARKEDVESPAPSPMGLLSTAARLWQNSVVDAEPAESETTKESLSAACSDNTSVDDFFDSTTTFESEDPGKAVAKKENTFVQELYKKRPQGLTDMSEREYSNAVDPPEDCKSSHLVAKEYIKAITNVYTPPRVTGKMTSNPSSEKTGASPRHVDSAKKGVSPAKPGAGARKFGFIPSPSFSKSLSRVTKDVERSNPSAVRRSSTIGSTTTSKDNHDTDPDTQDGACAETYNRRSSTHSESSRGEGAEASSTVLFGVSQMLNLLKKHIEKSSASKKKSVSLSVDGSSLMSPSSSQRNILAFLPQYSGEMYRHTMPFQGSGHMEEDLNRRLFSADERAYLLEEIEKKDNMLSMLTEGLREVEISQDQWLSENEMLSKELELALEQNQELNEDVSELKQALMIRERQLVFISGALPSFENF